MVGSAMGPDVFVRPGGRRRYLFVLKGRVVRVVALRAGVCSSLKEAGILHSTGPFTVGSCLPVIVNDAMAAGTELLRYLGHNGAAVISGKFIAVGYVVTVVASVIAAVVELYVRVSKTGIGCLV